MSEQTMFDIPKGQEGSFQTGHIKASEDVEWVPEALPRDGSELEMIIDEDRVKVVLDTLMATYEAREYPYNLPTVKVPQHPDNMPSLESLKRGGVEHARFLWSTCYYMRGGNKSGYAFQCLSAMHEDWPDVFDTGYVANFPSRYLKDLLKEYHLGFQNTVSDHWKRNAQRMNERYDGDPRKIFEGVTDYEEALKRVKNNGKGEGFLGFQEKMVSMILYYLMDAELIEPFVFPIPVDIHVMRVSVANEMITFPNAPYGTDLYTSETLEKLRQIYYSYALEHGVNPIELCNAVWLLSEALCGKHPGNVTLEPNGRANRTEGRKTKFIPFEVNMDDERQREIYAQTCAKCALERYCRYNLPGKPYYVGGVLYIRGERVVFPKPSQEGLFKLDN